MFKRFKKILFYSPIYIDNQINYIGNTQEQVGIQQ